jgi:hypothetical protein
MIASCRLFENCPKNRSMSKIRTSMAHDLPLPSPINYNWISSSPRCINTPPDPSLVVFFITHLHVCALSKIRRIQAVCFGLCFALPLFFESSTCPHHMVRCPSFFLFFDISENISGFARYVVALFVFAPAVIFEDLSGTPNVLDSFSLLIWQYRKFATSEPMVRCSRPLLFRHFRKKIGSARMFCTLLPSRFTS